MDIEKVTTLFNERKAEHNIIFEPKLEQMQIAANVSNGRNCLGFLPTGFGKTLCFVVNEMISDNKGITLIISPLLALMDDQMDALKKWAFSCAKISQDTPSDVCQGVANGDFSFVFASPESILKPFWRRVFLSETWQKQLSCIVFDEAHCLTEWGEDFRPVYREMVQLRSFFRVPVMAVTATCTPKIQEDIMTVLQLNPDDTEVVYKSPNRTNIMIYCQKRLSSDIEIEFSWLIKHMKANGKKSKKIIIYCRSVDKVSEIFLSLKLALELHAYADQIKDSDHLLVEMFHKCTHESSKSRILQSFTQEDSTIRCVIATVALGMGIDVRDIDIIVHYGCPKSVVSFWQEAGRCARDGRQGLSLILYDNFTASQKSTDKTMADIVRNSDKVCIRQKIMQTFSVKDKEIFQNGKCNGCEEIFCPCQSCRCCSFCALSCPCSKTIESAVQSFLDSNKMDTGV